MSLKVKIAPQESEDAVEDFVGELAKCAAWNVF